ncbi:UDP-N-acetylmuramate dehydrogenase [Peptococcaceae bacterium 1198_IL3148]
MVTGATLDKLRFAFGTRLLINEPMANHTSWRIGGPAQYLIEPNNVEELRSAIVLAKELGLELTIIGNGTNLLVKDSGLPGLVIKLGHGLNQIAVAGNIITAGAGAMLPVVARTAMQNGLAGLAWSAGIPGSVGGALVMNAGANGSSISKITKTVKVMDGSGGVVELTKEQLSFGYRTSALQHSDFIVLEATFVCQHGSKEQIKKEMDEYIAKRKAVQPQGYPNAGSVFKNPQGAAAGKLIEEAGCKGMKRGNALVSPIHANWIVNLGGASAEDVLYLIDAIREKVKEKFNVSLQLEVRVLG